MRRGAALCSWLVPLAAIACMACTDVVEVLTPPAGADPDAGLGGSSGTSSDAGLAGSAGSGGVEPRDAGIVGTQIDGGDEHACATLDGRLYCWGGGSRGKLGVGDALDRTRPARVGPDADWLEVTAAAQHSCARRSDGSVFCFGANDVGQLGVSGPAESLVPIQVTLPERAVFVVAESNTTCALLEDQRLFCWGENVEGQIGLGDTHPGQNYFEPVEVASSAASGPARYLAVDTGQGHVCGIQTDGGLYCWGRNSAFQCGQGVNEPQQFREPVRVQSDSAFQRVQAGQQGACGIDVAGELFCWGTNEAANLGTGDRETRALPAAIAPELDFVEVSIDTFHACAIAGDGGLHCWGRGIEGQLGTGDIADREAPALVSSEVWRQVAVGRFFTCAVRDDAVPFCAGANDVGQLGQGDTERRSALSPVTFD